MARAKRLHRSFLGGEPPSEVGSGIPPLGGIGDFAGRENSQQKPITEPSNRLLDPVDFGGIQSDTDNVHMTLPKPNGDFEWTQEAWGPALRCGALSGRHFFTTRKLELRGAPHETARAWGQIAETLGVAPERVQQLRQVHGASAVEVSPQTLQGLSQEWPEADVAISNDPTIGVAVRVADCVPLLLSDPRTGAVAAVHAGWRGMAAGAPMAAVSALGRTYGVLPADLVAAAGASIGPCCYTVGPELPGQFALHPEAPSWFFQDDGLRLDLWRATHDQLRRAGLEEKNIHVSKLCTACHTELFCSHRKEKERTGRLAGVIRSAGSRHP